MGIGLSTHILGLPIAQRHKYAIKVVMGSIRARGDAPLTWNNDCRFRGVNPIVGPDVNKVLGYYVPLVPL